MVKLASLGGMEVGRETQDFFLLFFPPVPTPQPPPPPHTPKRASSQSTCFAAAQQNFQLKKNCTKRCIASTKAP